MEGPGPKILVEETQDRPPLRYLLREVSPEELEKILEAHRKWVESEGGGTARRRGGSYDNDERGRSGPDDETFHFYEVIRISRIGRFVGTPYVGR